MSSITSFPPSLLPPFRQRRYLRSSRFTRLGAHLVPPLRWPREERRSAKGLGKQAMGGRCSLLPLVKFLLSANLPLGLMFPSRSSSLSSPSKPPSSFRHDFLQQLLPNHSRQSLRDRPREERISRRARAHHRPGRFYVSCPAVLLLRDPFPSRVADFLIFPVNSVRRGVAGPFGSSSPGEGDSSGLPPPNSLDQALEEQLELEEHDRLRREKGEPDWEVRFAVGDPENPLVSSLLAAKAGREEEGEGFLKFAVSTPTDADRFPFFPRSLVELEQLEAVVPLCSVWSFGLELVSLSLLFFGRRERDRPARQNSSRLRRPRIRGDSKLVLNLLWEGEGVLALFPRSNRSPGGNCFWEGNVSLPVFAEKGRESTLLNCFGQNDDAKQLLSCFAKVDSLAILRVWGGQKIHSFWKSFDQTSSKLFTLNPT